MAAGTRPFQGKTGFELSSAILSQAPAPLPPALRGPLPAQLAAVIERCLEKDPGQRYQRAGEVRAALEAVQSGAALPARPTEKHRCMAVLPITNLSGDPEQEYFADGMTEALITDLSKIKDLRVISRTSMMQYKGTKQALPEIARALKVETVLAGSVAREASQVRVTAQLIEAATGQNLWAESYEREFTSILGLQSEVARAVARTIRIKLRPEEDTHLASARAVNPATYEAYLKGMFHLNKGTPEEIKKGLVYLHEAVEKDPADPLANAGLALGYVELAHAAEAREDSLLRAKAAVTTALKLDGTLAEALAARAMVKGYYEWNWDEAFRDFDRALEVNPSLSMAYFHRAWFHVLFGHMAQAEEDQKKAWELDPFDPAKTSHMGMLYSYERRHEEAVAEALKSVEMAPEFPLGYAFLARIYRDKGMYDEAIAAARKAAELSPTWRGVVGLIYAGSGRREEARKLLAELDQYRPTPMSALWKIQINIALGEMDEAFRWLDYEPRHAWVPWVTVMPGLEALRGDPRFPELLRRMHLTPIKNARADGRS